MEWFTYTWVDWEAHELYIWALPKPKIGELNVLKRTAMYGIEYDSPAWHNMRDNATSTTGGWEVIRYGTGATLAGPFDTLKAAQAACLCMVEDA